MLTVYIWLYISYHVMSCPFPFPHPEAHAPPRKRNLLEVQENQSSGWQVHSQGGGRGTRSITQPTSLSLSLSVGRDCPQPSYEDAPKKPTCIHLNYDAVDMALHSRRVRLGNVRQEPCGLAMTLMKSAGLPACLIGGCSCFCSWFVLVSVLGLYLFLCSLAARFCFVWIKVTPPHPHPPYSYSDAYSDSDSSTPLLLPPFFPKYYLVVPVANGIAYSITVVYSYSSQDATVLID